MHYLKRLKYMMMVYKDTNGYKNNNNNDSNNISSNITTTEPTAPRRHS